jgi:hypothetical protein
LRSGVFKQNNPLLLMNRAGFQRVSPLLGSPIFLKRNDAMTKHKYEHPRPGRPGEVSDVRVPYWHRAHRDWRFLAVVFLMLLAIGIYLVTGDLAWTHHGRVVPALETGQ